MMEVVEGKGKVYPRTGHESPEGEYRYSSTLSLTSPLNGGGWSAPHPKIAVVWCGKLILNIFL